MVSIYAEVINLGDPDTEHGEHSENRSVKYENPEQRCSAKILALSFVPKFNILFILATSNIK